MSRGHGTKTMTRKSFSPLQRVAASDYDGLIVPRGVMSPDSVQVAERALEFVRHRRPDDLPVFIGAVLGVLAESRNPARAGS